MKKKMDYTKDKSLCELRKEGYNYTHVEDFKTFIQYAKFFCRNCGRSAFSAANLCNSDKLYSSSSEQQNPPQ